MQPVAAARFVTCNRGASSNFCVLRNCLKRGTAVIARYPTEHHEKSISDRPLRRGVGGTQAISAGSPSPWPPTSPLLARDPRCPLLCGAWRLRLAAVTSRLPAVEDRLPLLPGLAHRRHLGEAARG